jgi:hypothetical protein
LNELDRIHKELETQALALYKNFQEELAVKFRLSVHEVFDKYWNF